MTYDPERDGGARCSLCPLGGKDRHVVPPAPPRSGRVKLVIVGMAPGHVEDQVGVPFQGPSGKLLDRVLEKKGGRNVRADAWVTNASLCNAHGDNRAEDASAVCCAPRLYRELEAVTKEHGPVPIWALGKSAAKSLLNVRSIILSRGFVWTAKEIDDSAIATLKKKAAKSNDPVDLLKAESLELRAGLKDRVVLPMLHPAFVLRSDTWGALFDIDIHRGIRHLRREFSADDLKLVGDYRVVTTAREAERELRTLDPIVGMDIETDGVNPRKAGIRCVGVGDTKKVVMMAGTTEDAAETAVWDASIFAPVISKYLRKWKEVSFHNGLNFDLIALERDGVVFGPSTKEIIRAHLKGKSIPGFAKVNDTLIGHHAFAGHLPQKMDQVVSTFMISVPWKVVFGRRGAEEKGLAPHMMAPKELYMYGSADVERQAHLWPAIQADLESERGVYEHDLALAHIAKDMQVRGFYVDVARKETLRKELITIAKHRKEEMRKIVRRAKFTPAKLNDVRHALYGILKAPKLTMTDTGLPSTSQASVQSFASQDTRLGEFCRELLHWRACQKVRGTYLDAIEIDSGRSHFNWRVYGTVSGRWSSRMQSVPRFKSWENGGDATDWVREVYVATPGYELIYFDLSQSEMRAAAYLSGDEKFMATCAGDVHTGNARILFPKIAHLSDKEIKEGPFKECRDIAKNAGFGILYSAKIDTIYQFLRGNGFDVTFGDVQAMFDKVHRMYATYYRYCEKNLEHCQRHGFLRTALMKRIRWIGWHPDPGDPYNFMIQSFIADLMNLRMIALYPRLPDSAHILGQYHDALILEAPRGTSARLTYELVKEEWAKPINIPGTDRSFIMKIDLKTGDRWSQF